MPKLKPVHPGEILREEFMVPLKLNPHKLAIALRVPAPGIYEIVKEERGCLDGDGSEARSLLRYDVRILG